MSVSTQRQQPCQPVPALTAASAQHAFAPAPHAFEPAPHAFASTDFIGRCIAAHKHKSSRRGAERTPRQRSSESMARQRPHHAAHQSTPSLRSLKAAARMHWCPRRPSRRNMLDTRRGTSRKICPRSCGARWRRLLFFKGSAWGRERRHGAGRDRRVALARRVGHGQQSSGDGSLAPRLDGDCRRWRFSRRRCVDAALVIELATPHAPRGVLRADALRRLRAQGGRSAACSRAARTRR